MSTRSESGCTANMSYVAEMLLVGAVAATAKGASAVAMVSLLSWCSSCVLAGCRSCTAACGLVSAAAKVVASS